MKSEKIIILICILFIFILGYSYVDSFLINTFENSEKGIVERVIDGDTIVVNGTSIRLLGINSPEKGEKYSLESKEFLEEKVLGKEITIHFGKQKYDRYKRKLGYVFLGSKNINLESVKEGYSNIYFPSGKDNYYKIFSDAWNKCLTENINLCEKSIEKCIVLKEWDIKNQITILKNTCSEKIDLTGWSIKDEGRKKYYFPETILYGYNEIKITEKDFEKDYVWTSSGDSIFIRDLKGKLVLTESY